MGYHYAETVGCSENLLLRGYRIRGHVSNDVDVGLCDGGSFGALQRVDALYDGKEDAVEAGGWGTTVLQSGDAADVVTCLLCVSAWAEKTGGKEARQKYERYRSM